MSRDIASQPTNNFSLLSPKQVRRRKTQELELTLAENEKLIKSRLYAKTISRGEINISEALQHADSLHMQEKNVKIVTGNSSCTIVSCFTKRTPGAKHFWKFYKNSGYTAIKTEFKRITHKGVEISPVWCRIPTVLKALRSNPAARVLYLDVDTRVDLHQWCNFGQLGIQSPIIMNSFFRKRTYTYKDFEVGGSQVQANAFVVTPGALGIAAVKRWEAAVWEGQLKDQGAIHKQEAGLCGVPGWISCYSNPEQQGCHCSGVQGWKEKDTCVRNVFRGRWTTCNIK